MCTYIYVCILYMSFVEEIFFSKVDRRGECVIYFYLLSFVEELGFGFVRVNLSRDGFSSTVAAANADRPEYMYRVDELRVGFAKTGSFERVAVFGMIGIGRWTFTFGCEMRSVT